MAGTNGKVRDELRDYFRMDPHQLGRSQLTYELLLRRSQFEGSLRRQADAVAAMLVHEKQEGTDLVHLDHSPLPPDVDLEQCVPLTEILEIDMRKGRIDSHSLKALWSQATHLIERLNRIRTAGPQMAEKKNDLSWRARTVRAEVERQQDPFQSPKTVVTAPPPIMSTPFTTDTGPTTIGSGKTFQQMVEITADQPPTSEASGIAAIESRLREIFASPISNVEPSQTTRFVERPRTSTIAAAAQETIPPISGTADEIMVGRMSMPKDMTTGYRERVKTPDIIRISDVDEEENGNNVRRDTLIPEKTSPAFRMRAATITEPRKLTAANGPGAIPKCTAMNTQVQLNYNTPASAAGTLPHKPRTIMATATTTPIMSAIAGAPNTINRTYTIPKPPPSTAAPVQVQHTTSFPCQPVVQYPWHMLPNVFPAAPSVQAMPPYMPPMYQPLNMHPNWWPFQYPGPTHNAFGTPIGPQINGQQIQEGQRNQHRRDHNGRSMNRSDGEPSQDSLGSSSERDSDATEGRQARNDRHQATNRHRAHQTGHCPNTAAPRVPIDRWTVRFSGDIKPTLKTDVPIHTFLKSVRAYRQAESLTEDQLLQRVIHLLHGTAKAWYLNRAENCTTWPAFVTALKDAFLPPDCDNTLLMEAEQRKQQKNESVTSYLNDMHTIFLAMVEPVSESHQVCIVKRNLLPHFAMSLGVANPQPLHELASVCKRIEAAKTMLRNREEYQQKPKEMRPRNSTNRVNAVEATNGETSGDDSESEERNEVCVVERSSRTQKPKREEKTAKASGGDDGKVEACFNCDAPDHIQRNCPKSWAKHCYKCGHKNVTYRKCPRCTPQKSKSSSNGQPNFVQADSTSNL